MAHHVQAIWGRTSRRVRGLERQLRMAHGGNRVYSWGLPAGALLLCFTILVVAGTLSGASAAEFLPIAIFEALVIAGLFVACMMPAVSPPDDHGERGPDPDPPSTPPPTDPSVWLRLLEESNITSPGAGDTDKHTRREPTGAPR